VEDAEEEKFIQTHNTQIILYTGTGKTTTLQDMEWLSDVLHDSDGFVSEDRTMIRNIEEGHEDQDTPLMTYKTAPRIDNKRARRVTRLSTMEVTTTAQVASYISGSQDKYFKEGNTNQSQAHSNTHMVQFPTERRVTRLPMSSDSQDRVEEWFKKSQVVLGDFIPDEACRDKVKRLLYTYREIGATDIKDIPPTDLYEHRVRLKEGTKPWNMKQQKRWPPHKKYWLDRTIDKGLECGFFEKTIIANGELSDWNAQAILADKPDSNETGEYRVTFNYRNVEEDTPGCYLTLLSECHDYLSHPSHNGYFQLDLKHGYWAVGIFPPHRHYFAFSIPGKRQLQPTRMPQGSHTSSFSFTELMYIVMGPIPRSRRAVEEGYDDSEPSLITTASEGTLPKSCFYMDDIMGGFRTFEEAYEFLEQHLLPRLLWSQLKLSFKKAKLFLTQVMALGIVHIGGGKLQIKPERSIKIRLFPVPKDATSVRRFMGAVGITKRWIRNFAELSRPLNRLTGDVEWKWKDSEQVSFEIIRDKASDVVDMHGYDYTLAVNMYSDASGYGGGCLITQKRGKVEVPILFDSFTFTKPQRNYGVYKRELLAIVEFARKHDYMMKGPETSTIHTDHKPITYFLQCSMLEGIYARWACELRSLNIEIVYIPGKRNKVADALSRTIFPDENCDDDLSEFGHIRYHDGEPRWIWKDGKGGYEALIQERGGNLTDSDLGTLMGLSPNELAGTEPEDKTFLTSLLMEINNARYVLEPEPDQGQDNPNTYPSPNQQQVVAMPIDAIPHGEMEKCQKSNWYKDIIAYLRRHKTPPGMGKIQRTTFLKKCARFTIQDGKLRYRIGDRLLKCVVENEVANILYRAHDEAGHFAVSITLRRLRDYYWGRKLVDTTDYIAGCLQCAEHGTAQRTQTLQIVMVDAPMQMWGIDFIGPFPVYEGVPWRYILAITDYFSRFVWAYLCQTDSSAEVTRCLRALFTREGIPIGLYADPGPHFGSETQTFVETQGALWITSPSAAKHATGAIEKTNDIMQRVLKKTGEPHMFHQRVDKSVQDLNRREIAHLGYSPFEIHRGYNPSGSLEKLYPTGAHEALTRAATEQQTDCIPEGEEHESLVLQHMAKLIRIQQETSMRSQKQKELKKQRYDRGVRQKSYYPGQLVMLYDPKSAKRKLRPA
jgi:hypothetical protein